MRVFTPKCIYVVSRFVASIVRSTAIFTSFMAKKIVALHYIQLDKQRFNIRQLFVLHSFLKRT